MAYVTQTSLLTEPKLDKINKIICASSEDSDQLGHVPSLVSLHCSSEEGLASLLPIKRTAKTDQAGQMPKMIWDACCMYFVVFPLNFEERTSTSLYKYDKWT